MKLSTSKTELLSALQTLSRATPTRSTLPILNCALFAAEENGTTLRSTDLEITILTNLESSIEETGSAAIPLQPLMEITSELPDTRITLTVDSELHVDLLTDVGRYDLMGKAAEEFPAMPDVDNRKNTGIESSVLKEIIYSTSFAVSKDELKPALTGVFFQFGQDRLTAAATDGHRLVRFQYKDYQAEEFTGDVIIPNKFLNLISTLLGADKPIQVWMGDNHLTASLGSDKIFTRIIDERFPDYESVIPTDNDKELVVDRELLLAAVRRVSIFSNRSTHQIALNLEGDKLVITTEDVEKASKAQEELPVQYTGDPLTIGYNANYLRDILSHMHSEKVIVKLKTPISAGLFYPDEQKEDSDLTMLLMPIRLND